MHGLAVLQHNIVGNIDDVVDGTNTVCSQTLTQPLGRRTDLDIGNHAGRIAIAKLFCGNFHIQVIPNVAGIAALDNGVMVLHLLTESCSSFTGQADDGITVGTVIGNFEVHDGIIVADD